MEWGRERRMMENVLQRCFERRIREREREREEIGRTYKEKKGVSEEHSFVITHS